MNVRGFQIRNIKQTHLIASFRSILALKPPFAHSSAAPLPANSPRHMSDLPSIAAVIASIPIMMGVSDRDATPQFFGPVVVGGGVGNTYAGGGSNTQVDG